MHVPMREIFGKPIKALPAFREPAPQLELMDDQGVERTLMFLMGLDTEAAD